MIETTPPASRQSLRFRYLLLAAIVAVSLIASAIVTSWYVKDVSSQNASSLHLRDVVSGVIGDFRSAIWNENQALNTLLLSADSKHHATVTSYLEEAEVKITLLEKNEVVKSAELSAQLSQLRIDFHHLRKNTEQLIELRADVNWVYPILPYLTSTLLESNSEFETAIGIALHEIELASGGKYRTETYRDIAELRDIWRLKILNFRAIIINFSGLGVADFSKQEKNIDNFQQQIKQKLDELSKLKDRGKLGFEAEVALETMQYRADKWYKDFLDFKRLRRSDIWRADLVYFDKNIQPYQNKVLMDLKSIEKKVSKWSASKISAVEDAAYQINMELWGLSGLALLFVIIVYVMIERSVLSPIKNIADAISVEGRNIEFLNLPRTGSREIHTLISAFNSMRQQIHHRQMALEHQALHDSLTGLPNRALLHDRLGQAINIATRDEKSMTLLLLDLDRFKDINDTLGHQAGDKILQQLGERLDNCVRGSDTVARLGGDEFAIVCSDGDMKNTKVLLDKLVAAIGKEVKIDNNHLYVGVSIGVALYPQHGKNAETLIRHADIAMYAAKNSNKNYLIFDENLDQYSIENLSLLHDLRSEIKNPTGQITLHYQPQIDLFSRDIVGAEALLRWQHPKYGFVVPEEFIHIAEKSGLIYELTYWVLEQSIFECANWHNKGIDINVSVNLSAWDLQNPELVNIVKSYLVNAELPANKLSLEITESVVMDDPVRAREVLNELHTMGIRLVIDDFGTGFSSLAYLKLLPVSELKIDKSFVIDM